MEKNVIFGAFFLTQRLSAAVGRNQRVRQALLPVQVCDGQECPSYGIRTRMTKVKRLQCEGAKDHNTATPQLKQNGLTMGGGA